MFEGADKVAHSLIYAVLGFLVLLVKAKWHPSKPAYDALLAILFSSIYGVLMEILQVLYGLGRHFELNDIIANIGGSIIGVAAFLILFKQKYYGS